jgi:hypothetical protein
LASGLDIQGTDILTTAAATLIRITVIDRTTMGTMVGRHFIGLTDTECTTHAGIIVTTATGGKIAKSFLEPAGENSRRLYFFGEVETPGADVTVPEGDGS